MLSSPSSNAWPSVHYSVFITEALMMMTMVITMVMISLSVPAAVSAADYVLNFIFLAGPVVSVEEL